MDNAEITGCEKNTLGKIHSFESFGSVDGPGVRYIFFLQGCNMRCKYCHNPDTWDLGKGEEYSAKDCLEKALRYKNYWKNNGGITVSGGEALLQLDFVTELFTLAKEKNVNTCLDTSGNPFSTDEDYLKKFDKLLDVCDLVILDIKMYDNEKHKELTGHSNENILALAKYLSDKGIHMWIRYVLVPGVTNDRKDMQDLRNFVDSLKTVDRVEVLPYHTLGVFKYEQLGIDYRLKGVNPPTAEEIAEAKTILEFKKD